MADLESFFAKKDKKKKGKKSETFTPDDLLKKIELAQKEETIEAESQGIVDNGYDSNGDQPQKVVLTVPSSIKDDEEWEEFETNREIDLSTLKIQNLGEKEKERQEVDEQEELQKAVEESKSTMKWNIAKKEDSDDDDDEEEESEPSKKADEPEQAAPAQPAAAPQPARYIPPNLRGIQERPTAASGPALERISIKKGGVNRHQIDVNSVEQFPSLGMAAQFSSAWGGGPTSHASDGAGAFTSVRKGARGAQEGGPEGGLSTSNKYSMLKRNKI